MLAEQASDIIRNDWRQGPTVSGSDSPNDNNTSNTNNNSGDDSSGTLRSFQFTHLTLFLAVALAAILSLF